MNGNPVQANPNSDRIVILNVDDYEAGRYATSRVLRQAGFHVLEADTGGAALRLVRDKPDLVVLDVNLPDLSGFEVCRRIREDPETAAMPVLYLSAAYRGPEHRVQGLELGADGFLTQPVDPRELVATVNSLLRARHVRDAVRESELRFRSLMTATSDIIWITDPGGGFVDVQEDWEGFTGQSRSEYEGSGWLQAVHPDDREKAAEAWTAALQEQRLCETEYLLRRADGEYRYMQVRAVPVLETDGAVREWVGASTDVTGQQVAQRELWERNERLQFLSEAADRLLRVSDPREYIEHLFHQLATYLDLEIYLYYRVTPGGPELGSYGGISPEQAEVVSQLGTGEPVCLHAAERRRAVVLEEVGSSGDPRAELVRSLGVTAYACYPLVSEGRLIGILSFGTRSREHFSPDELSLMQTVCNQAAAAIERAQLIVALQERARALEEANRAKADFLATMSHELRTPLNAMMGYADLLLLGVPEPIPDGAVAQVDRIRTAALHLGQLIEEVLTHARLESGRDEIHLDAVVLEELIQDVVGLMEPLAQQKELRFVVDRSAAPREVRTDGRKLRQILLNLLANAVKFTDRGEVELEVRTDRDHLLLSVRDTGIGIASEHLEKIFEAFWQVDGTKTRKAGGTGLGLGVARQLAQKLGGGLRVESTPGVGTRFMVELPLEPAPPVSAPGVL